jgi:sarcosine oxidase delta subunit
MTVAAPAVINDHDSAKYNTSFRADPAIDFGSEDDGQITRPRHTKPPSKEHSIGFTFVTQATRNAIEQLWKDARGGSDLITGFKDPTTGAALTVRFKVGSVPQFNYRGKGGVHYWDISNIVFVEV